MSKIVKSVVASILICLLSASSAAAQAGSADLDTARSLLEAHRYDEAMAAVDGYLKQHPRDPAATLIKSDVYSAQGEWDRAVDVLEDALSQHVNNIDVLLALAVTYRQKLIRSGMLGKMSNAKKSKKALEKAFAVDPTHLETRREMFMYLVHAPGFAGGDKDRAAEIAKESLELDEFEGRFQLATVYWKNDDLEAAVEQYRRALVINPDDIDAMIMLGDLLMEKKDFDQCRHLFESHISTQPDRPEPYKGLGDCYSEQKMADDAIEKYLIALELDEWYGDARFRVARLYEKNHDKEQAAYHYRILIERNPGYVELGKAKKQLRKIEKGR